MGSESTQQASAEVAAVVAELKTDETFLSSRIQKCYPCNPLQGLLMNYSSNRSLCILQYVLDLPPKIELPRFQHAWNRVVASCEILRTRIFMTSMGAMQVVMDEGSLWASDNSLAGYLSKDLELPMGYGLPLSRSGIIGQQKGSTDRFFVLTIHQSVHDDHTLTVLLNQLCSEYQASDQDELNKIECVPLKAFAQQPLGKDEATKGAVYPFNQITTARDPLTGGIDWVPNQVYASSIVEEEALIGGLDTSNAQASNILYSAWAIVLSLYAQSADVTFGTIQSQRNEEIPAGATGEFTGPELFLAPVRAELNREETTMGLVSQMQNIIDSQNDSGKIGVDGNTPGEPFSSLLYIRGPVKKVFQCGEQTMNLFCPQTRKYPYPLLLECHGQQNLHVVAHFDESIFSLKRVTCFLHQFLHVARQLAIAFPTQKIRDIEVLSPHDKDQIWKWNDRPITSINRCTHHVFEEVAARSPDRIAIDAWDGKHTYKSLDEQSNRLAHALRQIGVGPEVIVALCLDKSKQVPVSILAIQKAGGACLTLDTQQPVSRLKSIITDGGISIMLADEAHMSLCESLVPRVICVDEEALRSLLERPDLGDRAVHTENATSVNRAFVLYTSGSTGAPKGIDVPHSAMCTSIFAIGKNYNVSSDSRIFQYSSYGFDVSAGDMFLAMFHGACLCIPSEYDRVNNLERSICDFNANWLCTTPSVLGLLNPDKVPCLKAVAIGGEALPKHITLQWAPRVRFQTGYGPSETGVFTSVLQVENNQHPNSNIGHALGCHHWIVHPDDYNQLAPLGCPGELVIEGPTVSRGYLNRPDLTSSVFLRQPMWFDRQQSRLPSRFYKTGDIVKYDDDGKLIFVGRKDSQIKYHGQRIEPADIEFNISQHHLVVEAVVLFPSEGPYSGRLVAAVAMEQAILPPSHDESIVIIDPDTLQRHLKKVRICTEKELPPFMWPTDWLLMSKPPLNNNGKMNRRQIRDYVERMGKPAAQTEEPPSPTYSPASQKQLNQWQQVMQAECSAILHIDVSEISMESSFVSLGGDSLTAIRLVSVCRDKGVRLDVRDILRGIKLEDLPCSGPGSSLAVSLPHEQREPQVEICAKAAEAPEAQSLTVESVSSISGIPIQDIQVIHPCYPIQEGILLSQSRNQALYQTTHTFEITSGGDQRSTPNIQKITLAWRKVIERHDALRVIFLEIPDQAQPFVQVVLRHPLVQVTQHASKFDLLNCPEESFAPLTPPHRLRIAPARDGVFICKLEMSHAITDGMSMELIFRDLVRACDASNPFPVPLSKTIYGDYIKYLRNQDRDAGMRYWMKYLKDADVCHLKMSVLAQPPSPPALQSCSIDIPLQQTTRDELRRQSMTVADLLQLTWAILLGAYTDQEEICFGYINSARAAPLGGIEDIVGAFVNLVTCRLAVKKEQTPLELMATQKNDFIASIPHQHVSMGDVMHGLGMSTVPLFNTLVSILRQTSPELGSESKTRLRSIEVYDPTEYDLTVTAYIAPSTVTVRLDYWTDKASSDSIQRLATSFGHIFHATIFAPRSPLKELRLISDSDLVEIEKWNNKIPRIMENCIHGVISAQSQEVPQNHALCSWDGELTYDELDAISDTFSEYLKSMGVRPEVSVPFCFEKSVWAIVAMIAILKAGGAIVPLDPTHPISRRLEICGQVDARIIVVPSGHSMQEQWSESELSVVEISDTRYQQLVAERPNPAGLQATPSSPADSAYIVFTSGTTGEPKGIVTDHRSFCSGVAARSQAIMRSSESRVLQFASFAFDTCLEEILTTLMVGGCVCIPSEQERVSDLAGAIKRMNVNSAELTPSVAKLLQPEEVPSLKVLLLGGEQVTADLVTHWGEAVTLINSYGPAECSVTSVVAAPYQPNSSISHASNIGFGVGALTWVVSSHNHDQLVPIGGVGELLIEGPILARGYHGRQDLTDASFITDPSWAKKSDSPPRRFYKTGDLVHYAPDGSLICLGRRDGQIKLHGQRIELDEIDSCLLLHSPWRGDVASCLATSTSASGKSLIAAFFSTSPQSWQIGTEFNILPLSDSARAQMLDVEAKLASSLPIYMRPSLYVPVDKIPTSTSGKKFRATLTRAIEHMSESQYLDYSLGTASSHHQPETREQKIIQELWSRVLKLPIHRIGIYDDFFRLGGDSIFAMKLCAVASKQGSALNVADIFRYSILHEMAERLAERMNLSAGHAPMTLFETDPLPFSLLQGTWPDEALEEEIATTCHVSREAIEDVYPCSAMQEGLMALSMRQDNAYVARLIYTIPATTSTNRLKSAWNLVASRYPLLRTRIILSRHFGSLQVVIKADSPEIDAVPWENSQYCDLQSFLKEDEKASMTYGSALSRCAIVTTPTKARFFVWTVHHAMYDGWLLPTILKRTMHAYQNEEAAVQWSTVPFPRFIAYLQTRTPLGSEDYWKSELEGFRQVDFPTKDIAPEVKQHQASKVYHQIKLDKHHDRRFTTATILRAAWAFLVSKYSESDDITFGAILSGRTVPVEGITKIGGPTLTTVPVRVHIDCQQHVVAFLQAMQAQATGMMPHEHVGLQNIRKLGEGSLEACNFQNLLVIQPMDEKTDSDEEDGILGQQIHEAAANPNFHTYPLVLSCTFSETQVDVEVIFNPSAMSQLQIERLVLHFEAVFQCFRSTDSTKKMAEVEMITSRDRQQIKTWNEKPPKEQTRLVHDVVAEQTFLRPDSEAVHAWDGSLTYKELHLYSAQLALVLREEHHIGPEKLVPLLFEKSVWAVVAMFGVMKAGGGFVPLDVSHPLDRVNDIISQCNADLALVSSTTSTVPISTTLKLEVSERFFQSLQSNPSSEISDIKQLEYSSEFSPYYAGIIRPPSRDQMTESASSHQESWPRTPPSLPTDSANPDTPSTLDISTPKSNFSRRAAHSNLSVSTIDGGDLNLGESVKPNNVVYVIFTSGSTGKPKGVVIQHDQFCSGVIGPRQEALLRSDKSRVLQFASFSFDTSLEDIITTLFFGGCVCIPSEDDRVNDIAGFINRSGANTAHITPSFANTLSPQSVPGLKYLRLGGERMTPTHISKWALALELRNAYGPTETSITATCSGTVTLSSDPIDIGHGVAALTWIVNPEDHDQLTPLGLVGELLVEGPLLARGYLGDAAKTNASFITNPKWARTPGKNSLRRFYKTGDLVRYGEEGNLLYIGRKDTQIKIYGQRIEIGEIEDHLKKALLPRSIDMAVEVTTVLADNLERKVLVAFLCLDDTFESDGGALVALTPPIESQLRELTSHIILNLSKTLPAYMIPSRYIPLRSMPRTLAGKADRRKLQQILTSMTSEDLLAYSLESGQKQPLESETEFELQRLWAEVLAIETSSIGAHDSFLRLGGDSITAIKLAAALRDHGMPLTVADIFQHPELRHMAAEVDALGNRNGSGTGTEDVEPFGLLTPSPNLLSDLVQIWDISKETVHDVYPCTPLQEGMLAVEGSNSQFSYGSRALYDLPANVDLDRFKASFETVVRENEILRTRIVYLEPHGTLQVVTNDKLPWDYPHDINQVLETDYSFGLGTSLLRVALCPTNQNSEIGGWTFILTMHHSLYDGWSLSLILQQVDDVYHHGLPLSQNTTPRFRDFVRHLRKSDAELSGQFWTSQLSQCDQSSDIPLQKADTTSSPSVNNSVESYHHSMPIPKQNTRSSEVTLAIIIRAAWALVVRAYSGCNDVRFGLSVAGRNVPVHGIDKMVGPTLATIPCRLQVDPSWTLQEFLSYVNQSMIDSIPYEHFGLQQIKKLGPDSSRCCDFNSLLVIQPQVQSMRQGLFTSSRDLEAFSQNNSQTYPILVECQLQQTGGLNIDVSYRKASVSALRLERIVYLFQHMVEQLYHSSDMSLTNLSLVSPFDLNSISTWNQSVPAPVNATVAHMLKENMDQRAKLQAIHSWDLKPTYKELFALSRRLSNYLRLCGVQRGSFVPIVVQKSALYIVCMLAVIYTGAAFVPLDASSTPVDRMKGIFDQCQATVVLASTASASDIIESGQLRVLRISHQLLGRLPDESTDGQSSMLSKIAPSDPLYCIFTSGTTGWPKGVLVTHQAYASSVAAKQQGYGIDDASRVLQFCSNSFDISIDDILISLLSGGCLCVPSEEERRDSLSQFCIDAQVNYACITPTVARTLDVGQVSQCLKRLRLGGEKVTSADISDWTIAGVNVISIYGPTECCVCCSTSQSLIPGKVDPANIGLGIACRTWVVDPQNPSCLSPISAVGELLIEGPSLARGYLHDQEKTLKEFIDPPVWMKSMSVADVGTKCYKTGDLVRYDDDGSLIFVSRKDTQVKLRGMRMELEEVEQALRQINLPNIQDLAAEVVPSSMAPDILPTDILVLFVVKGRTGADKRYDLDAIRVKLRNNLPEYMIPGHLIILDCLPTSSSDKTNRPELRRLAVENIRQRKQQQQHQQDILPNSNRHARVDSAGEGSTIIYRTLQGIWAGIFKSDMSSIGPDANFFQLGGDSILVMRLVSGARAKSIYITSADVHQLQTLSAIVSKAKLRVTNEGHQSLPLTEPKTDPTPISPDLRLISLELGIPEGDIEKVLKATDFQSYCLAQTVSPSRGWLNYFSYDLHGGIDTEKLKYACHALVERHEILRARFVVLRGSVLQVIPRYRAADVRFEVYDESTGTHNPDTLTSLVHNDRAPALNDVLIRFVLHIASLERVRLTIRISHAQYDGICMPIIQQDLHALYSGHKMSPPLKFLTYVEESERLLSETNDAEHFWSNLLRVSRVTPIVVRKQPNQSQPKEHPLDQSTIRTVPLSRLPHNSSITPATIVKSAWALVLSRLSRHDDVVFGHLTNTRPSLDHLSGINEVVGPCLNLVPIRVQIGDKTTGSDLLAGVQQQYVDALPHTMMGFQRIIERCTKWSRSERFSSILQYQNLHQDMDDIVIGNAKGTLEAYVPSSDAADLWIMVTPIEGGDGDGMTEIKVNFSSATISPQIAESIIEEFCHAIAILQQDTEGASTRPLRDTLEPSPSLPKFPVSLDGLPVSEAQPRAAIDSVRKIWEQVFGPRFSADKGDSHSLLHTPFHGDALSAGQLSSSFRKSGVDISPAEAIDYPTIFQQSLLWNYKLREASR